MIKLNSTVQVTNEQVSADLEGATVVLQLSDGVYYQLNGVGGCVWARINEGPCEVSELVDNVLAKYDVDRTRCEADVIALLQDMSKQSLVEVTEPEE